MNIKGNHGQLKPFKKGDERAREAQKKSAEKINVASQEGGGRRYGRDRTRPQIVSTW